MKKNVLMLNKALRWSFLAPLSASFSLSETKAPAAISHESIPLYGTRAI